MEEKFGIKKGMKYKWFLELEKWKSGVSFLFSLIQDGFFFNRGFGIQ